MEDEEEKISQEIGFSQEIGERGGEIAGCTVFECSQEVKNRQCFDFIARKNIIIRKANKQLKNILLIFKVIIC